MKDLSYKKVDSYYYRRVKDLFYEKADNYYYK
jgi:hypothetical protein